MDFVSITAAIAMVFGLLTADAVVSAETVAVQINVPTSVAMTGYTEDVAELIFTQEFEAMNQTRSLLRPPVMRSARQPTIVGVIASSLRLDNFTAALQEFLGLQRTRINGAIVDSALGDGRRLLVNSSSAYSGTFSIDLNETGEVDRLLRRAAIDTMERVQPYRAALFHFDQILRSGGTDFSAVVQLAERELSRQPRKETLEERSFLQNLLGIVALLKNDLDDAERRFRLSFDLNPPFAIGRINLAFVHVQRDKYQAAIDLLKPMISNARWLPASLIREGSEPVREAIHSTFGVALWAQGDLDGADAAFRRATHEFPSSAGAYSYWARLLHERGDAAEAGKKAEIARINALTFENFPEVATLYFWMSPRNNEPLLRRSDVPILGR